MSKLENLVNRLKGSPESNEGKLSALFPPEKIEAIKKEELRRFRMAQDKKWRNWLKAVLR